MFTDITNLKVEAGKGGDGRLNFYRTRGNAKGGPDGGNGGAGGNVILHATHNTNTLAKYRSSKLWKAADGGPGGANLRHGRNGEDITLFVPPGTVVREGNVVLHDLDTDGAEAIIARGGIGGFGNAHFKSSVRQSPQMAELGEAGEAKELVLELKLAADVGLVGLPNAGKSTLLSMISNARPEIADYPFTTLVPNLGVVDIDEQSFLVADIPGLIEGASEGKGLGDDFLRHVERTRVLIQLIDVNSTDIIKDYETIRQELKNYTIDLSKRPYIVAITKAETKPAKEVEQIRATLAKHMKVKPAEVEIISALAKSGLTDLLRRTNKMLLAARAKAEKAKPAKAEIPVITLDDSNKWEIAQDGDVFVVSGEAIEGFARRTNFSQTDGLRRLRDILRKKGIDKALRQAGMPEGGVVRIAGKEFGL